MIITILLANNNKKTFKKMFKIDLNLKIKMEIIMLKY